MLRTRYLASHKISSIISNFGWDLENIKSLVSLVKISKFSKFPNLSKFTKKYKKCLSKNVIENPNQPFFISIFFRRGQSREIPPSPPFCCLAGDFGVGLRTPKCSHRSTMLRFCRLVRLEISSPNSKKDSMTGDFGVGLRTPRVVAAQEVMGGAPTVLDRRRATPLIGGAVLQLLDRVRCNSYSSLRGLAQAVAISSLISQLPIPNSQFPTPNSQLPIPNS